VPSSASQKFSPQLSEFVAEDFERLPGVIVVVESGARYAISAEMYKTEVTCGHCGAFGEVPSITCGGANLARLITDSGFDRPLTRVNDSMRRMRAHRSSPTRSTSSSTLHSICFDPIRW
jgi:hypothetical protein